MTGKESTDHPEESRKNKVSSVDITGSNYVFDQYKVLVTQHEILKENHETLKTDYKSLKESYKLSTDISELLKVHQQNQTKELETKLEGLVKDLEKERSEKEVLKNEMERMKRKTEKEEKELKKMKDKYGKSESEKEELKKKIEKIEIEKEVLEKRNQELLNAKEKEEKKLKKMKNKCHKLAKKSESEKEELKKEMERIETEKESMSNELENKYVELAERFVMVEKDCSYLESLYDAEKLTDLEGNKAITDPIVIMDDSDAESDNAAAKSNKLPQNSVDSKQKQQFDIPNSSKRNHLPSSPSSLSSDEFVIKRGSIKRPRV